MAARTPQVGGSNRATAATELRRCLTRELEAKTSPGVDGLPTAKQGWRMGAEDTLIPVRAWVTAPVPMPLEHDAYIIKPKA